MRARGDVMKMRGVEIFTVRTLVLTLALLVAGVPFSTAKAQLPGQILEQAYLNIKIEPQQTMEWCWVASARMVATYYNRETPPQCAMLHQQYGAPCCANPQLCTVPGHITQIQQLIQSFGLHVSMLGPPTNGYVLLNLFEQGHPVVIHLIQGHFAVASGIKVVATPMGPLGIVRILDPFYGVKDVPLPILLSQWDAAIYVQ
jgi:hypothetical protein